MGSRYDLDRQRNELKLDFSRRLKRAMASKGWNQKELADQATKHMTNGKTVKIYNISSYCLGKSLPHTPYLDAICKALGLAPGELLVARPYTEGTGISPPSSELLYPVEEGYEDEIDFKTVGTDARLNLRCTTTIDKALQIMAILRG